MRIGRFWRLPLVLACQLALTVPWLLHRSEYGDEALYTWAGHVEMSRWMAGRPAPPFGRFFSGLPTLYPPLAALTSSLLGARLVSTAFALLATVMLYLTICRVSDRTAAVIGCSLFAILYPTMHIGSFATYDAMALGLLATAGYFAVRAADDERQWPLLCALVMLLANAAKYASVIYDPVIIGIAAARGRGHRAWLETTAWWVVWVAGLLLVVGRPYVGGILMTTLTRTGGTTSAAEVLYMGFRWEWPVLLPAVAFLAWCAVKHRGRSLCLTAVLTAAMLLAPLGEARLHTLTSLDKHVAFGAWFGAIASGWAISSVLTWLRARSHKVWLFFASTLLACGMAIATALSAAAASNTSAESHVGYLVPKLRLMVRQRRQLPGRQTLVLTDSPIPKHVLPSIAPPQDWRTIRADKHGQIVVSRRYLSSIRAGRFTAVALSFRGRYKKPEMAYWRALAATPAYRFVGIVPFGGGLSARYYLWRREETTPTYFGVAVPNRRQVQPFVAATHTHPNMVETYLPFGRPLPAPWIRAMGNREILPVVQLNPRGVSLQSIASGRYDRVLEAYASDIKQLHFPVVLSFGHEMNGAWYPWGCRHVRGRTFIAAWRHMVMVMRQARAINVIWMWDTNPELRGDCSLVSRWPGSKYVNWVGLDGYLRKPGSTFRGIFGPTLARIRKLAPRKPVLLAETGVLAGSDQAARIRDLYQGALQTRVLGIVYFDGATQLFGDYRPQDSPVALRAFRRAVSSFRRLASAEQVASTPAKQVASAPG